MAADLGLLPVMPVRRAVRDKANAVMVSLKATTGMIRRRSFLSIFANRTSEMLSGREEIQRLKPGAIVIVRTHIEIVL